MNFVPQQKTKLNPLIKMNCLISENTDKKPVNIHNRKEKGKEKIEENKINQEKSEKKLKTIKLNSKPVQIKSQENKIMSTGRPSSDYVSTHNKKMTVKESTQYGKPYNRSTPINEKV